MEPKTVEIRIPEMTEPLRIIEGKTYRYIDQIPAGCKGQLYRVVKFACAIPVYRDEVVLEGISGPDKGNFFTCSPNYFSLRFRPMVDEIREVIEHSCNQYAPQIDHYTGTTKEEYSMISAGSGV